MLIWNHNVLERSIINYWGGDGGCEVGVGKGVELNRFYMLSHSEKKELTPREANSFPNELTK